MKFIFTLLTSLFFLSASSQQWKVVTHYSLAIPQQEMGSNIQAAHSLQAGILYQLPGPLKRVSAGLQLGVGTYAHKRINQTFRFDNNTSTVVPVNYNSNVFNINVQTRVDILDQKKFYVVPYINAKAGMYNFFSNVYIDDPHDPDGCRALERENIIKDNTMYWSAGGGVQINPDIFGKRKNHSRVLIDISANTIRGGTLNYINTKDLMDAQEATPPGGKPLNVRFINASTQSIHEHTVAQVYTSPLRMLEFTAGITVMLGRFWR